MLLGLLIPSSGRVTVLGADMARQRHRALQSMNFTSPYVDLPRRLTVDENLRVYNHLYGLDRIEARLDDLMDRTFGTLPAGQKSRVSLAKALVNDPVLLWEVLLRGQLGVSVSFFEEMWWRNLGHLFVSPLRSYQLICALLLMSFIRATIGVIPASLLTIAFYDHSIYARGLPLVAFFFNPPAMGWSVGLVVSGMVLRAGLGLEGSVEPQLLVTAALSNLVYLSASAAILTRLLPLGAAARPVASGR